MSSHYEHNFVSYHILIVLLHVEKFLMYNDNNYDNNLLIYWFSRYYVNCDKNCIWSLPYLRLIKWQSTM